MQKVATLLAKHCWELLALVAWCMQTNATTAKVVGGCLKEVIHSGTVLHMFFEIRLQCARLAQLVRSLTANQEVPGSSPGLVEG